MNPKLLLIPAAIGLGIAAVRLLPPMGQSATVVETATATPARILAALPPAPASESGRSRQAAQDKVKATPDIALGWTTLGDALAQEFRDTANESLYAHTESVYRQALAMEPKNTSALSGLAWVYGSRHEFPESIAWAERALQIDPLVPAAHGIIGDAQLELGRYEEALESYQKMIDARPDLSSWSRGAHLLWLMGDADKAKWLMEKAIRAGAPFAENTAWCRARLAMMHFSDGALLPAAQILAPALQAGSQNIHLLRAAARVEAARGNIGAAEGHCRSLLARGPDHDALVLLGDLCLARGEAKEAEAYFARVEAHYAAHPSTETTASGHTHPEMARFFADHDRNVVEALRIASQHKLSENTVNADLLAWTLFKNGDVEGAAKAMKRALRFKTPDPILHYHAGMIAVAAGDHLSAVKHLQRALSLNASFDPVQAPLARQALEKLSETAVAVVEK
jgi:tetratricopeptide (TPR) repeat protein